MTPVSILRTLAITPDGTGGIPLDFSELSQYLSKTLNNDGDRERNKRHALRDELYRDGGVKAMRDVIDHVFTDDLVKELRKKWVEYARFNNALKRIVNELSTVYSEPSKRSVTNETDQAKYEALLELLCMDEQMLQVSRLLSLHRAMLVGFRVRKLPDGEREPVLDIASPADVRVLMHPNDNKLPIGWAVRASHKPARLIANGNIPAWTLWTDVERVSLRDDFTVIPGTYKEHGLGVCPWVPVTLGPMGAGFWPGDEGEDLVSAHIAIWLTNVFLLKESKSATKQTVLKGDGTNTARGQAADTEVVLETADGQSVDTIDMSMDLSMFRQTADHILEHAAQNYGMSAALINHQGVQSAEARELMRLPLRELRKHQQVPLRRFEQRLAFVMSKVLETDLPSMTFNVDGWRIEFGDSTTPMDKIDELNLFLASRAAGTDNTIDYIARQRPGMTPDEATDEMFRNIGIETVRNVAMRPMQQISGSMGAQTADPNSPDSTTNPATDKQVMAEKPDQPTYLKKTVTIGPVPKDRSSRGASNAVSKG